MSIVWDYALGSHVSASSPENQLATLFIACSAVKPEARPGFPHIKKVLSKATNSILPKSLFDCVMQRLEAFAEKLETDVMIKTQQYENEIRKTQAILQQIYPR